MGALAIAALGLTLIAMLLLLLAYALKHFTGPLASAINNSGLPLAGSISRVIKRGGELAVALMETAFNAFATPAVHLITYPVYLINHMIARIRDAIIEAEQTLDWVVRTRIPQIAQYAFWKAGQTLGLAERYALHLRNALAVSITNYAHFIEGYAHDLAVDAETYAASLFRVAEANATAAVAAAEAAATGEVNALAAQVPAIAASVATAVIGITATDIDNVIAPDLTGIIDDAEGVIGAIASDFPDIGSLLKSVDLTKVTDVAGELGLSVALSRVAARYLRECGIPNCRNLSKFGRDLQALFGVVEDGALFALLAALITDPADTVQPLHDFLAPIAGDAIGATRDLVGV